MRDELRWWDWLLLGFLAVVVVVLLALAAAGCVAAFLALVWVIEQIGGAL